MSTIAPSRLKNVEEAALFMALCQDNFAILADEVAKRVATYVSGSPTTIIGPPTTGARVLNEFWRDALGGEWLCTVAGTPGTWLQIRPAPVAADPAAGSIPTGYLVLNVTQGLIKRHGGGYVWNLTPSSSALALLTADSFEFPNANWTNYSQQGSFAVTERATRYLLDSAREEPVLFPACFMIPAGCAALKFSILYRPEATCDGSKVGWKIRHIRTTDNAAWSAETAVQLGADTLPASGQNPQLFTVTLNLAALSLAVGDWVRLWLARDATDAANDTFANDVGLYSATIEAV